jgi:hypothetical protein
MPSSNVVSKCLVQKKRGLATEWLNINLGNIQGNEGLLCVASKVHSSALRSSILSDDIEWSALGILYVKFIRNNLESSMFHMTILCSQLLRTGTASIPVEEP